MSDEKFGISLNFKQLAASQYRNFNFNSMCVFNGQPLGANDDGLFSLFDSETDDSTAINSIFEFPISDLGRLVPKRLVKLYVGYETSGSLKFTTDADGRGEKSFTLTPVKTGQIQHRGILPTLVKNQTGVYWMLRVENVLGCDFSVDDIEGIIIIQTMGRR